MKPIKKLVLVASSSLLVVGVALSASAAPPAPKGKGKKPEVMRPFKQQPPRFKQKDYETFGSPAQRIAGDPLRLVARVEKADLGVVLVAVPIDAGAMRHLTVKASPFEVVKTKAEIGPYTVFENEMFIEYPADVNLEPFEGRRVTMQVRVDTHGGRHISAVLDRVNP